MLRLVVAYLIAALAFGALDAVWLTQSYTQVYLPQIGALTRPTPEPFASLAFYLVYLAGLVRFAVAPGVSRDGVVRAMINGACFGCVAYATYDLTNLATIRGWTLTVSLVDMVWGTVASAVASGVSTGLTRRIFKV